MWEIVAAVASLRLAGDCTIRRKEGSKRSKNGHCTQMVLQHDGGQLVSSNASSVARQGSLQCSDRYEATAAQDCAECWFEQ